MGTLTDLVQLPAGPKGQFKINNSVLVELDSLRSRFEILEELIHERSQELGIPIVFTVSMDPDCITIWWQPDIHAKPHTR